MKPEKNDVKVKIKFEIDELELLQNNTWQMAESFGLDGRIANLTGEKAVDFYSWNLDCLESVVSYLQQFPNDKEIVDRIANKIEEGYKFLKENKMIDILINISKIGLKSIFTAKKYDTEILDEDLKRILFIKNYLEENLLFVKENYKEVDSNVYFNELKEYAVELFSKQCEEAISEEEKNSKDFNLENHKKEDMEFFEYVYTNLEYPEYI
jgi:hypothetical protein